MAQRKEYFNESLRKWRLGLKTPDGRRMSQQKLANKLDIGIVTLNRWERGIQRPSPLAIHRLAQLGFFCEEA